MSSLREMTERWKSFDPVDTTATLLGENSDQVIELNKEQLMDGEGKDGLPFYQYKQRTDEEKEYAKMKNEMNPRPGLGNADFNLTGAFQSKAYLQINGSDFTINSEDEKTEGLKKLAKGAPIFGLTEDSKVAAWGDILRNPFVEALSEHTGCPTQ